MYKLSYQTFYTIDGLADLQKRFESHHKAHASPEDMVEKAVVLEKFLSTLFQIDASVDALQRQEKDHQIIFKCKRHFIQRRVKPAYKEAPAFDPVALRTKLSQVMMVPFKGEEDLLARHVLTWMENPDLYKEALTIAEHYAAWALLSEEGQAFYKAGTLFHLPQPLDFNELFPINRTEDGALCAKTIVTREGFDLTDPKQDPAYSQDQANYCLTCHRQSKDSCRTGIGAKDLEGCPLDQKISEMMMAKQQGHLIAALAIIALDNPMVAATGRRICNACSKACIFQKQTPVDVPSVETEILESVLALPFGFEIYSLLTRWNPLREDRPLPLPPTNKKVLIVGMGPAGFGIAHHLLQDGHTVVGIDGLTIQRLPPTLQKQTLIKNIKEFFEPLDQRKIRGFGGVADYGITARWNKNFLLVLRLILERQERFLMLGNTRLESTLTTKQAFDFGFDHIALCMGAGKPNVLPFENSLAPGIMQATDFLMRLHVQGLSQKEGGYPLLLQSPIVVIGSGLTAVDAATEARAYYKLQKKEEADVKILYRKAIQESPAYRKNHEELQKALEEGVQYLEHKTPQEFLMDKEGHVMGILCQDGKVVPARTILMAIGTNPQTVIAEERPDLFQKEDGFLKIQADHTPFTTARVDAHRFISVLGDLHPSFSGSVVHALASAKKAAPFITEKLASTPLSSSMTSSEFRSAFKEKTISRVAAIQREQNRTRLTVSSPFSASNLKPGHFFRLQIPKGETLLETLPLMGIPGGKDRVCFFIHHSEKTEAFLKNLSLGDALSLMGPTGEAFQIPSCKNVLVHGAAFHKETLEFIGREMEKMGCQVSYDVESTTGFDEVFTIGKGENAPSAPKVSALVQTKMHCMMKGICAKCLRKSKDPATGKEMFVNGCQSSIDVLEKK
jgi:NADPH-dependent glutamate synthase beta subunit-like oxidoreductase